MAACAINTAIRSSVAAGGNINHLVLLDNFCWCDAYNLERPISAKESRGLLRLLATAFKTPFISGKGSMFNDFKGYYENGRKVMISVPFSLFISAIRGVENVESV